MSLIRVALENITYKCSHQTSSSISVSAPVGGKRAQSIVTLATVRFLDAWYNKYANAQNFPLWFSTNLP